MRYIPRDQQDAQAHTHTQTLNKTQGIAFGRLGLKANLTVFKKLTICQTKEFLISVLQWKMFAFS